MIAVSIYYYLIKHQDTDLKNSTYYFYNDIINIRNFDPRNIKIDGKSYRNILDYYIGNVTIDDSKYIITYSVNFLYLIFNKVNLWK